MRTITSSFTTSRKTSARLATWLRGGPRVPRPFAKVFTNGGRPWGRSCQRRTLSTTSTRRTTIDSIGTTSARTNTLRILPECNYAVGMSKTPAQIADHLDATVRSAAARLHLLDESHVSHRPAPDRWTIKEVIGHLIDSCANNHQRFVRAQAVEKLIFMK